MPQLAALIGVTIASAFGVVLVPVYGGHSDRFGRKPIYDAGAVTFGLFAVPSFLLINTGQRLWVWLATVVALGIIYPAIYSPLAAFWCELFGTRVRYPRVRYPRVRYHRVRFTGVGAVYPFSGVFASGLTPVRGAALVAYSGGLPMAVRRVHGRGDRHQPGRPPPDTRDVSQGHLPGGRGAAGPDGREGLGERTPL